MFFGNGLPLLLRHLVQIGAKILVSEDSKAGKSMITVPY